MECSRGVVMPREELDKMSKEELDDTSKERIIKTSDKDKT
jgi:hypothetical protein